MEPKSLDTITDELRQQRTAFNENATTLRTEVASLEDQIARIDSALRALSGDSSPENGNGRSHKPTRKAPQLPSAKKADVVAAMRRVLEKEHMLQEEALKTRVEAELKKDGFTRLGLAMRFKEAFQDAQFVHTPEGIRLAECRTYMTTGVSHGITNGTSTTTHSTTTGRTHTETKSLSNPEVEKNGNGEHHT